MRRLLVVSALLVTALVPCAAQAPEPANWRVALAQTLPLLGHRNWILIVDSAYPLEVAPGIETVETGAPELEVVRTVLADLAHSRHVQPYVFMDAELPFVPEQDAPGVTNYRSEVADLLHGYPLESQPHTELLGRINQEGAQYHILVLKTAMAIPYTSVFIRLDCKYWSDDAERRLRAIMH